MTTEAGWLPRRVFITGASGFIGRALADRCRALGADVRGMDRAARPDRGIVAGDVATSGEWQSHVDGCDLVIHTAAAVSLLGREEDFWRVNVLGTRHVLDAASAARARRFVHISSVVAYSFTFPDGVDEHHPVRCNGSPYVDTKVTSEQVVLQAHSAQEVPCTVIRPGDVYGPRSRPWTVIPVELMRRRRFAVPPRGVFSPVYIDNLVDGILLAATRDEAAGRVFALTDGAGVTNEEFFGHYARMLGVRLRTLPAPALRGVSAAVFEVARLARRHTDFNPVSVAYLSRTGTYSIEQARRVLGYVPAVGLAEGMARTETWLRQQGLIPTRPDHSAVAG